MPTLFVNSSNDIVHTIEGLQFSRILPWYHLVTMWCTYVSSSTGRIEPFAPQPCGPLMTQKFGTPGKATERYEAGSESRSESWQVHSKSRSVTCTYLWHTRRRVCSHFCQLLRKVDGRKYQSQWRTVIIAHGSVALSEFHGRMELTMMASHSR